MNDLRWVDDPSISFRCFRLPGSEQRWSAREGGEESSRVTMAFCIPIAPNLERLFAIVPASKPDLSPSHHADLIPDTKQGIRPLVAGQKRLLKEGGPEQRDGVRSNRSTGDHHLTHRSHTHSTAEDMWGGKQTPATVRTRAPNGKEKSDDRDGVTPSLSANGARAEEPIHQRDRTENNPSLPLIAANFQTMEESKMKIEDSRPSLIARFPWRAKS